MRKAIFFVFIALLSIVSCTPAFNPCILSNNSNVIVKHQILHQIHKTFYIDIAFSAKEQEQIIDAIRDWECSMGGRFAFDIVYDTQHDDYYWSYSQDNIFIWRTDGYHPRIVEAEKSYVQANDNVKRVIVGLYVAGVEPHSPAILLAMDRMKEEDLKITVLHEIGHSAGLNHPDTNNSIMFAHLDKGARKITRFDIDNLCKIYKCFTPEPTICND